MSGKVWNRLEDQCCVQCGAELISPKDAQLSMCSLCVKQASSATAKQVKNRKNRAGQVKRLKLKVNPAFVKYKK